MKNFKPGQKVVFKSSFLLELLFNKNCFLPENNSILTISHKYEGCPDAWCVVEFPKAKNGKPQTFPSMVLFPIEEKEQTVTLSIKKIKLEPKEVLEKTEELLTAN